MYSVVLIILLNLKVDTRDKRISYVHSMWSMSTQWSTSTHTTTPLNYLSCLTSLLMDPLTSECWLSFDSFTVCFLGCNHVTALLILMNAYIFPASCLHFRTSLWSITANRWVHLQYSSLTVCKLFHSLWLLQLMSCCIFSYVFLVHLCPT